MGFLKGVALAVSEGQELEFAFLDEAYLRKKITKEEYEEGYKRAYETIMVDVVLEHYDQDRRKEAEAILLGICAMLPDSDPISIDFLPQPLLYSISLKRATHLIESLEDSPLHFSWERSEEE